MLDYYTKQAFKATPMIAFKDYLNIHTWEQFKSIATEIINHLPAAVRVPKFYTQKEFTLTAVTPHANLLVKQQYLTASRFILPTSYINLSLG